MASKALVNYIKQQIEAGYDVNTLRIELIKRGHKSIDVENAISEAQKTAVQKKHFPTMLVLVTIILAVIIVLFFVLLKLGAPEEKIIVIEPEALIREEKIPEPTEEITPEEEIIPTEEITPEELPDIKPEEIPAEIITRANITRVNWTQIDFIRQRSLDNKEGALLLCSELNEKDLCYFTLAKTTSDFNICGRIASTVIKDQCFLSFAAIGKNVCGSITDRIIKEGCNQLISLNITRT